MKMTDTMPKTVADAIMDFAMFLCAKVEIDAGNTPDTQTAIEFAREEFKDYCAINHIRYIDENC